MRAGQIYGQGVATLNEETDPPQKRVEGDPLTDFPQHVLRF